eukprot:gene19928-21880_t
MKRKIIAAVLLLYLVVAVSSSARWTKLNCKPVCYGAKGGSFGVFFISKTVKAYQIKLQRTSGRVSCHYSSGYGYFRCARGKHFGVFVTDTNNKVIVPPAPIQYVTAKGWYRLNGNNYGASTIVLSIGLHPYIFRKGGVYRVWYGEDLFNSTESDNVGRMCVNVYALQ